jgi:hypothetical protein
MTDGTDDPAVQDATARMRDVSAILTQSAHMARAELATRGLHPVSVAHGDLDSAEAVDLTGRLAVVATELGCAQKIAANDATTYLLPSAQAAAAFICEATGFMLPCWTVTDTARPVYDKIDGLAATLMPGLRDPLPDLIGPGTDWERAINAWCRGRGLAEDTIAADRDPGQYQQAAVKRLGPAFRAARLGHVVQWDPPVGGKTATRQWACVRRLPGGRRCLAPVYVQGTRISGAAVTRPCPGRP